jgi:hypothetical protein
MIENSGIEQKEAKYQELDHNKLTNNPDSFSQPYLAAMRSMWMWTARQCGRSRSVRSRTSRHDAARCSAAPENSASCRVNSRDLIHETETKENQRNKER